MTTATVADPKNSTTVRFKKQPAEVGPGVLQGLMESLAPQWVADRAFEAWCTPPRPRRPRPPLDARAFELDTPLGTLKAWEWGMRDDAETVLLVHGWGASAV